MPNKITEYLKKILNARYGKDVRNSIVGAIEQCYEDATEQGNANMEVVAARGDFDSLKKRLDATKEDISKLNSMVNDLKKSTEYLEGEQIVGTWEDGKPIYRRRMQGTITKANQNYSIISDSIKIDTLISVKGLAKYSVNSEKTQKMALPYEDPMTGHYINYSADNTVNHNDNTSTLMISYKTDYFTNTQVQFWIKYTKLTDTVEEGE